MAKICNCPSAKQTQKKRKNKYKRKRKNESRKVKLKIELENRKLATMLLLLRLGNKLNFLNDCATTTGLQHPRQPSAPSTPFGHTQVHNRIRDLHTRNCDRPPSAEETQGDFLLRLSLLSRCLSRITRIMMR